MEEVERGCWPPPSIQRVRRRNGVRRSCWRTEVAGRPPPPREEEKEEEEEGEEEKEEEEGGSVDFLYSFTVSLVFS